MKFLKVSLDTEVEVYEKRYVPGLAEVSAGWKPRVPTTIYQISGDDTSGIAGLMYPDGRFLPCIPSRVGQPTKLLDESEPLNRIKHGIIGWDGIVTGTIENGVTLKNNVIVNKRVNDPNELLGDYGTSGELWQALERGTMQVGRQMGRIHLGREFDRRDYFGDKP